LQQTVVGEKRTFFSPRIYSRPHVSAAPDRVVLRPLMLYVDKVERREGTSP
jgi:hypothetical protein